MARLATASLLRRIGLKGDVSSDGSKLQPADSFQGGYKEQVYANIWLNDDW